MARSATHVVPVVVPFVNSPVSCPLSLACALALWLCASSVHATAANGGYRPATIHAVSTRVIHTAVNATPAREFDAGYFRLQAEPCVPLQAGPQRPTTATRLTPTITADDALLRYRWRQVQQRLVTLTTQRTPSLCYYFAP